MRAFVTVIESESQMDIDYISVLNKEEEAISKILGSMESQPDKACFVLMVLLKLNKGFICVDVFKAYCNRFGLGANIPNNIATSIKHSPRFDKENQILDVDFSDLESTRREYNALWQAYKKEQKAAREEVIAG